MPRGRVSGSSFAAVNWTPAHTEEMSSSAAVAGHDMLLEWLFCVTEDIGGFSLSGEREQWIHEHVLACLG